MQVKTAQQPVANAFAEYQFGEYRIARVQGLIAAGMLAGCSECSLYLDNQGNPYEPLHSALEAFPHDKKVRPPKPYPRENQSY